jgi:hypothetical protein
MEETYKLLDLNPADTTTLEAYLQVICSVNIGACACQHHCCARLLLARSSLSAMDECCMHKKPCYRTSA